MDDFRVFAKRGRMVALSFASLVFVAIGILMVALASKADNAGEGVMLAVIGAVSILFFGFCLWIYIRKLVANTPLLILSEEGLTDQASYGSAGFIRWEEIRDIGTMSMANQQFLCIFTHDPDLIVNRMTGLQRMLTRMNKGLSSAQAHIPLKLLRCPLPQLLEEIEKRAKLTERSSKQTPSIV
ncbi:hypothetical protein D3P09_16310 [Paenibacillus pinisoli]|uniref:Uncharacterized protein n=1 Tax=Paenibacillus pinisoli TaxID=1276110 RepID=A0A3A6PCF6_9BACL|nr:STM3941 family protein [Paenibacillus pinisoli]RJX39062.1 hypothetical protein D3P09_16310 [Paenibacillus pinisoli]